MILWDAAVLGDTRIPRQLVFDLGPRDRTLSSRLSGGSIVCDLGSNYKLPFRADPSMQLVGIKVGDEYAEYTWSYARPSKMLLIRSQVLSEFASRIGTTSLIRWKDWLHLTKPILIRDLGKVRVHLVHSHLVSLYQPSMSDVIRLRVFDFSLEHTRRERGSGVIGEFSDRLIPVTKESLNTTFYLSTSNIIFKSVSVHDSVSSTSLGTLLASSGLNATPPSTLGRRTNTIVGVYSVGSSARLYFTQTSKSISFFSITRTVAVQSLESWILWARQLIHFVWFTTVTSVNNSTHTGSRAGGFSPARGKIKSYFSCRSVL